MKNWCELCKRLYKDKEDIAFLYCDETGQKVTISYAQYYRDIVTVAGFILENNMQGKHIGVMGENTYETVCLQMGVLYSGSVLVPFPLEETSHKYAELVGLAEVECFLFGKEDGDPIDTDEKFGDEVSGIRCFYLSDCIRGRQMHVELEEMCDVLNEDDDASIIFTSGTTSVSKAVLLTQRATMFFPEMLMLHQTEERIPSAIMRMWTYPFHHVSFFSLTSLHCLGTQIVLNASPKYFIRDIKLFTPNGISAVPAYVRFLKKMMEGDVALDEMIGEHVSVIDSGGAALEKSIIRFFIDRNINICDGYGLTEATGAVSSKMISRHGETFSLGKPYSGYEIKCVDKEIWVKSPSVMKEYYGNPQATQDTLVDGWLHTGDLGFIDHDGELHITGRRKNLIILSNGENVCPEEIEEMLLKCDLVKEVLVYEKDNHICAEIYSDRKTQVEVEKFVKEYNKRVAGAKKVQEIRFRITEFPKTSTGKIIRGKGV